MEVTFPQCTGGMVLALHRHRANGIEMGAEIMRISSVYPDFTFTYTIFGETS